MCLCQFSKLAIAFPIVITLFFGVAFAEMPSGWFVSGSDSKSYEMGLDHNVSYTGRFSAYIKAVASSKGSGALMQDFQADHYRGKRVRLSAYVKSVDVKNHAGLWMRVDGNANSSRPLAFDNMSNRPIKGTTDWTRYEVVLDIPAEAVGILFGVLLEGPGTIWSDNLEFGVVDATVPVTSGMKRELPKQPVNLDFEQR